MIHRWYLHSTHLLTEGTWRFLYVCRRCDIQTYNGVALPAPANKVCAR